MKNRLYGKILSFIPVITSAISCIFMYLSQEKLNEIAQTAPDKVVQAGDIRFTFALLVFFVTAILTYYYISTWHSVPLKLEKRDFYTRNELIVLTIISIASSIANFGTLNITWEFSFIGFALIIYETATLIKYYK